MLIIMQSFHTIFVHVSYHFPVQDPVHPQSHHLRRSAHIPKEIGWIPLAKSDHHPPKTRGSKEVISVEMMLGVKSSIETKATPSMAAHSIAGCVKFKMI